MAAPGHSFRDRQRQLFRAAHAQRRQQHRRCASVPGLTGRSNATMISQSERHRPAVSRGESARFCPFLRHEVCKFNKKPDAISHDWAVQSRQGELWLGTCKLLAATAGRTLPSPLPINNFSRNVVIRPRSVASPAGQAKKNDQGGSGYRSAPSQGTPVICSGCGQPTTVPFEPRGDRPVYCRDCYTARKGSGVVATRATARSRHGSSRYAHRRPLRIVRDDRCAEVEYARAIAGVRRRGRPRRQFLSRQPDSRESRRRRSTARRPWPSAIPRPALPKHVTAGLDRTPSAR